LKFKVVFKKYKILLVEFFVNIFSFSIFITAQQIVALPIIARLHDANHFGKIVLAIGFIGIITSMLGFSIGNARLLDQKFYNSLYLRTFLVSNLFIGLISFITYYYFFSDNIIDSIIFLIICVLANYRNFFQSEYRIRNTHNNLFRQNLWYFLGTLFGILIFFFQKNWLIIFLVAEIFSVLFSAYYFRKIGFFKLFIDNSRLKYTNIIQLILNNGASYSLSQYDRFLIYPLLGPANVSLFYSASISSKIGALVMNPLSNYILGKLAIKKEAANSKLINLVVLVSFIILILYFFLSILTTPVLVKILYPDFLTKVEYLIIPLCLGGAIMAGVNILKPVVMKYFGVKFYNNIFYIYGLSLISLSVFLGIKYNLIGIAIANIISGTALFLFLLICLNKFKRKV